MAKKRAVRKQDELDFVHKTAVPLLHRLGFRRIRVTHGADEYGRDLIFHEIDRFGHQLVLAAQAKYGNIRGTQKALIHNDILPQLKEGLLAPYQDPETGETHRISRIYLLLSGALIGTAKQQFHSALATHPNIVVLDQHSLDLFASPGDIETIFGIAPDRRVSEQYTTGHQPRNPRLPMLTRGSRLSLALFAGDVFAEEPEVVDVSYDPIGRTQTVILRVELPPEIRADKGRTRDVLAQLHSSLHESLDEEAY